MISELMPRGYDNMFFALHPAIVGIVYDGLNDIGTDD
jgi:hypothetical protein